MQQGYVVYSPISHTDRISKYLPKETHCSWDFWREPSLAFVSWAHRVIQLMIPGWKESIGCKAEREYAYKIGLPVNFMTPEEIVEPESMSPAIQKRKED